MRALPIIVFLLIFTISASAQHLRIYACAIANDSVGASMGGSSNGSGLYQSDDTGKTWKHLGWDNIKCYSMDMVQSSNSRILYEATGLGILRSVDYGGHWKQITDWRISEVLDVDVNPINSNIIWIATAHGPWWSQNGGSSWKKFTAKMDLDSFGQSYGAYYSGYVDGVDFDPEHMKRPSWDIGFDWSDPYVVSSWFEDDKKIKGTLDKGMFVNGEATLPHHQIWTVKHFLVTP